MNAGIALGIDIGTSGVRAALLDAQGAVLGIGAATLVDRHCPAAWWQAAEAAIAAVRDQTDLARLRAVAVDGTSGTLLAVNAAGEPIGPVAMYDDPAPEAAVRAVAAVAPIGSAARGPASTLAKALVLQARPGVVRLLHQADWIAGRLLGAFGFSDTNNALKTGYDPVAEVWPAWLRHTGLCCALLPEVKRPGSGLGKVSPTVAAHLGLPAGVRVVAGTTDGCAAFLAAGAAAAGDGVTSLGSTLVLKLAADRAIAAPEFGVYSHRLGDTWLASGASNTGGAALACHFDTATLVRLSAQIDPMQASPLDYYPLPRAGERFPWSDPQRASSVAPRPADDAAFLHGLLESIARIEAAGYRRLAALGAPSLTSVRSVGGGARNAAWTAIRARVLGVPLIPAQSEDAAAGAANLALRSLLDTG